MSYWTVPELWNGESCAIIASGPSLTRAAVQSIREAGIRTIVINTSYQLAPWADVLYFCDSRWWGWHAANPQLQEFISRAQAGSAIIATLENLSLLERHPYLRPLRNSGREGLVRARDAIRNGSNSGYQALNLAFHLGAKHIILLGYDMQPDGNRTHHHEEHPVPTPPSVFSTLMLPAFNSLAPELEREGVLVHNCSEKTALKVFRRLPLQDALRHAAARHHNDP